MEGQVMCNISGKSEQDREYLAKGFEVKLKWNRKGFSTAYNVSSENPCSIQIRLFNKYMKLEEKLLLILCLLVSHFLKMPLGRS